ncbi:Gfo/Idh/MocA family protein [Histidinibacterium lentulum]|uniref:Gfo/Idh/MocA family oxidoreductase n=1 Tax=Histidinibacterium lentulum TaxID=2480588 RepID=A0A3N2RAC0_9RHOB|nr:Gfo/Idh/MocA family oxidoreductase [Histidinibacterium lentulum]ROU04355.1 gfo/Idh/MocA family oxidoreductase [Histidinibacterium lentulum]
MQELGVGIIGCGNISTAYLKLAPLFRGITVRAVADMLPEAAKARAEEYGVRAETVEGLLAAEDIDIVVNLTIPDAHYKVTLAILEAGKHAYSEKPLVLSLDEGKHLRSVADKRGLRIGSAPDTFLGGAHQQARAVIDEGRVGRIVSGTCHVMSHGMEHWHPNPFFFFQPGAGPVLDIGPYYVTNLIQLIGPVKRVVALAGAATPTRTVTSEPRRGEVIEVATPTNIHALLDFENGAAVTLSASWDVWAHRHGNMELYGTEGSLILPDPNFFGGTIEISGQGPEFAPLEPWSHPLGVPNQDHRQGPMANYRTAGLADMAQAIGEGREHRCSMDLALHAVDVMTGILRSGETGGFVEMTTTCARPEALGPEAARALLAEAPVAA